MKRSKRYRACLVLFASMGASMAASTSSLLLTDKPAQAQSRQAQTKQVQPKQNTSSSPETNTETSAEADRVLTSGISFIRQGNITAAISAFEQAVSLTPNSAAAQYNLGLALRQNNQLQAAASAFWQATQADPEFVLAYINLGAAQIGRAHV